MDKGKAGLDSYGQLLKNIQSTLAKNNELTQKLSDYQASVITVKKRANQTDDLVSSLSGENTIGRIQKSKGRIQDLLNGMFKQPDEMRMLE